MIEYSIEGLPELQAKLDASLIAQPVKDFFSKAVQHVEGQVKEFTPVDTGRLRASVTHSIDAKPVPLWGKVGTNVFYAPHVEFGTRPHFPPLGALSLWASRHGFDGPFMVCLTIARRGTKGHFMFKKGFEQSKSIIESLTRELGEKIKERWEK